MLQTLWLLVMVSFSLYCLSVYMRPLEGGTRNARALIVGILGLTYIALHFRATYSLLFASLPHPAVLFRMTGAIVSGMWVTMLISMGFRRGARTMLIISAILFAGLLLALALPWFWRSPKIALHSILTLPNIYILEAWPIGIAIPAIIQLWRSGRNGSRGTGKDNGLAAVDSTTQKGMEA